MNSELIQSKDKKWTELSEEERQELISHHGEPYILRNLRISIQGKTFAGQCPGNEAALSSMIFLSANLKPNDPMAIKLRERMRDRHSIELVGPILHFNVDGINPRILFVGLIIDAEGNIHKPGRLYTYNSQGKKVLQSLLYDTQYGEINNRIRPLNDEVEGELILEEVRMLGDLPMHFGTSQLQDEDGRRYNMYPSMKVAEYFRSMLLGEAREGETFNDNDEEQFYKTLLEYLP